MLYMCMTWLFFEIPIPEECLEKPMYFSYFVVHKDSPIQCVSELNENVLFGINGSDSLSGCHSIRFWLHQTKRDHRKYAFFQTGGHAKTLGHIANGTLDCGAIDIVCLLRLVQESPDVNIAIILKSISKWKMWWWFRKVFTLNTKTAWTSDFSE